MGTAWRAGIIIKSNILDNFIKVRNLAKADLNSMVDIMKETSLMANSMASESIISLILVNYMKATSRITVWMVME